MTSLPDGEVSLEESEICWPPPGWLRKQAEEFNPVWRLLHRLITCTLSHSAYQSASLRKNRKIHKDGMSKSLSSFPRSCSLISQASFLPGDHLSSSLNPYRNKDFIPVFEFFLIQLCRTSWYPGNPWVSHYLSPKPFMSWVRIPCKWIPYKNTL